MSANIHNLNSIVLSKVSHDSIPNINGFEEQKLFNKYKVTSPSPIYASGFPPVYPDLCLNRVKMYQQHNYTLERCKAMYKLSKRKKAYRKLTKNRTVPVVLCKFASELENDPDPYFEGEYDWFLTGGNVDCAQGRNNTYLLHTSGRNFEKIMVSKFDNKNSELKHLKMPEIEKSNTDSDLQIYEIQSVKNSQNCLVTARRRHMLSFFSIDEESDSIKCVSSIKQSSVPFISCARHPVQHNLVTTSNLQSQVHNWNLEVSTEEPQELLFSATKEDKKKNWNSIKRINENSYAFINTKSFAVIDSRQSCDINNSSVHNFKNALLPCEQLTNLTVSDTNPVIYLTSYHKVFPLDLRFIDVKEAHSYFHNMEMPPVIAKTLQYKERELVLLSSHINGDIRLYESCESNDYSNVYMIGQPIKIPTISETISKFKIGGKCLYPALGLERRKNISISGAELISCNGYYKIITSLSNGDIFSQNIFSENDFYYNADKEAQQYESIFGNPIYQKQCKLYANTVENLTSVKRVLSCRKIDNITYDDIQGEERIPKWKRGPEKLKKFKDSLSSSILSIWDIEKQDLEPKLRRVKETQEEKSNQSISKWLDDSIAFNNSNNFLTSTATEEARLNLSETQVDADDSRQN